MKITDYEVVSYGVDHEQYFPGVGTAYTEWTHVYLGAGYTEADAYEYAKEQLYCTPDIDPDDVDAITYDADDKTTVDDVYPVEQVYTVTLHAFCGMEYGETFDDLQDARDYAASELRRFRRMGMDVDTNECGAEWESHDPEDAAMISDNAGILTIVDETDYDEDRELYFYVAIYVKAEDDEK